MKYAKTFFKSLVSLSAAGLLLAGGAANAASIIIPDSALNPSPGVYTPLGYYTNTLGPNIVTTGGGNAANVGQANGQNDDGFMSLALGFDVTFFGTTYNSLFINNNGNVSFGAGISAFVPTGPTGANQPIISPFFADVDTRASDVVYYDLQADQLVVTWNAVGWYNSHSTPTNSFQLVLRSDTYVAPVGEGSIGFFYQTMGWESSDAGQNVAAVGFGDGAGNSVELASSLSSGLNGVLQDQYLWFDPNLDPVDPDPDPAPAPATLLLLGLGLLGMRWTRRRSA